MLSGEPKVSAAWGWRDLPYKLQATEIIHIWSGLGWGFLTFRPPTGSVWGTTRDFISPPQYLPPRAVTAPTTPPASGAPTTRTPKSPHSSGPVGSCFLPLAAGLDPARPSVPACCGPLLGPGLPSSGNHRITPSWPIRTAASRPLSQADIVPFGAAERDEGRVGSSLIALARDQRSRDAFRSWSRCPRRRSDRQTWWSVDRPR